MRTARLLLILIIAAYFIQGFASVKCEHAFTEVQQAEIKIKEPEWIGVDNLMRPSWPTGKQEGKELICVKCFYKQRQILDYGEPVGSRALSRQFLCDTALFIGSSADAIKFDSVVTLSKGGSNMIKAGPWIPISTDSVIATQPYGGVISDGKYGKPSGGGRLKNDTKEELKKL